MTKVLKSKLTKFFFISSFIGIVILIIFNYSQIENYQTRFRNEERQRELKSISENLKRYISEKNSCPRTNIPVSGSFLPELIIDSSNNPRGGVSLASLEDINSFLNKDERDPSGIPYFVGTFDNLIYVYTNDFEVSTSNKRVYYQTIEANLCNQVVQ